MIHSCILLSKWLNLLVTETHIFGANAEEETPFTSQFISLNSKTSDVQISFFFADVDTDYCLSRFADADADANANSKFCADAFTDADSSFLNEFPILIY